MKLKDMIGSMASKLAAFALAFTCVGSAWAADPVTIQDASGNNISVYEVSSGFYQDAATYTASRDFYITSKAGLLYFRTLVNADDGGTAAYEYCQEKKYWTTQPDASSFYQNRLFADKTVHLLIDVDFANESWTPIGYVNKGYLSGGRKTYFYGNFDGHGHKVSNLTFAYSANNINNKYYGEYGLFGYLSGSQVIQNVTVENVQGVTGGYPRVGGIVGNAGASEVTLRNCHVIGIISLSGYNAGGLCSLGSLNVINCSVEATGGSGINGTAWAGGLVGAERAGDRSMQGNTISGINVACSDSVGTIVGKMADGASGTCAITDNDIVDCTVNSADATLQNLLTSNTEASTEVTLARNTVRTTLIVEIGDLTPAEEITPTTTEVNYTVPVTVKDRSGNVVSETTAQEIAVSVADADIANTTLASVKIGDVVAKAIESVGEDATSVTAIEIQVKSTPGEAAQSVTYEVHPEAVVTVSKTGEAATSSTVELSNSDLVANATFTFELDVSSITGIAVGDKVKVTHSWEAYTDAAGNSVAAGSETTLAAVLEGKKVRITTTHFSTWTLEGITIEDGAVAIVFGADGAEIGQYTTLAAAIDAAQSGNTITLLADIAMDSPLNVSDKTVTIDLDGNQISLKTGVTNIIDADVTIVNGTINIDEVKTVGANNAIIEIEHNKSLTLDGVTLEGEGYRAAYGVFYARKNATLNVTNCTFTLENDLAHDTGGVFKGDYTDSSLFNITDSTLNFTDAVRGFAVCKAVITGSDVSIVGSGNGTGLLDNAINRVNLTLDNSNVTISGGSGRGLTLRDGCSTVVSNGSTLTISDMGEGDIQFQSHDTLTVSGNSTVSAGTVVLNSSTTETVDNLILVDATSSSPVYEAQIGRTLYKTLAEALDAAVDGTEVIVVRDISLNADIEAIPDADANVTLTQGDYTITANGHAIILSGSPLFVVTTDKQTDAFDAASGYTLVKSGSYVYTPTKIVAMIGETPYTTFADAVEAVQDGETITVVGYDDTMVAPEDWKFVTDDTVDPAVTTLVRKVYVAQIGETKYETLQAAVDAATNGQTVEMLSDADEDVALPALQNVVLDFGGHSLTGQLKGAYNKKIDGLLIKNGTIIGKNENKWANLQIASGSKGVVVENMTLTTVRSNGTRSGYALYNQSKSSIPLRNVIADGRFYVGNAGSIIAIESGTYRNTIGAPQDIENDGVVAATGGTFYYNPTTPNNLVAQGYVATEGVDSDNVQCWTVARGPSLATVTTAGGDETEYWDVAEAIGALTSGATLTIKPGVYNLPTPNTENNAWYLPANVTIQGATENGNRPKITSSPIFSGTGMTIRNIDFEATSYWKAAMVISNGDGTVDNCVLNGASGNGSHGFYYGTVTRDGTLKFIDSTIVGDVYGLHVGGDNPGNVIIQNCVISGWNSYGTGVKVVVENTEYRTGEDYNYLGFYDDATLSGCIFSSAFEIEGVESNRKIIISDSSVAGGGSVESLLIETGDDHVAIGRNIDLDEDGYITRGIFETIDDELIATGYISIDNINSETSAAYPLTVDGPYVAVILDQNGGFVNGYTSLAAAIAAAEAGQTVELLADVDLGTTGLVIDAAKDFTLDIGAFNITGTVNGKLITNNGTVTVEGTTGCIYNQDISAQGHDAFLNTGTATVNGGWFGDSDNDKTNGNNVNRGAGFRNFGTATINGGHFTAGDNFLNGGWAYAIINGDGENTPTLTINDADVYGKNNGNIANNSGEVVVNGGVYDISGANSYYSVYSYSGNTTVKNGSFAKSGNNNSQFCVEIDQDNESNPGSIAVEGGYFTKPVPAQYCAVGYSPAENTDAETSEDYHYTVAAQYEAHLVRNGEVVAGSGGALAAVIAAAEVGDTVKLLADVTTSDVVLINKSITLDGDGHKLITSDTRGIRVTTANVDVTIKNLEIPYNSNVERGIQIDMDRDDVSLTLENVKAAGTRYAVVVIAGSDRPALTLKNVELTATYPVHIAIVDNPTLVIQNSQLEGYCAMELYGNEGTVTIEDSTLIGVNNASYNAAGWNDYGVIVIEGDVTGQTQNGASRYDITVKNTAIVVDSTNGNSQWAILYNNHTAENAITLENCTVELKNANCTFLRDNGAESVTKLKGTKLYETQDTLPELPYGYCYVDDGDYKLVSKAVAQIGNTGYASLADAIAAVPTDGTPTTITMIADVSDAVGISVASGKNFIVDFDSHTYTVNKPGAGSSGTETSAFQLLEDSTITFKNGTINIAAENLVPAVSPAKNIKRIIQNYANLTLDNMVVNAVNQYGGEAYALSFNNGSSSLINGTKIVTTSADTVAFDVYDYSSGGYASGSQLTIGEGVVINGKVVFDNSGNVAGNTALTVTGGTIGQVVAANGSATDDRQIQISGGTFGAAVPEEYCANGFIPKDNGDGTYGVKQGAYVAQIGETGVKYETLAEAIAAVPTDGTATTVTLLKDVSGETIAVNSGRNVVLDLGGHELTPSLLYVLNGALEAKNGTIKDSVYVYGLNTDNSGMSSTFTLAQDATIASQYGVILYNYPNTSKAYDATVNINGTVLGNVWVMGNITEGDSVINVAGTVDATGQSDVGIALNGNATVNVVDGAVVTSKNAETGLGTGIEVRAGTLNVTGGTIAGQGSPAASAGNGSGTTSTGVGIAVSTYEKSDISVNISGGKVTGYAPLYFVNTTGTTNKKLDVAVTGGTFTSNNGGTSAIFVDESEAERVVGFISGGYFSTTVDKSHCAVGYESTDAESGAPEKYMVAHVSTGYIVEKDNGEGYAVIPAVDSDWIKENVKPAGATTAEIEDALNTKDQTTQLKKWQAYVLNQTEPIKVTEIADTGALTTTLVDAKPDTDTRLAVTYSLVKIQGGTTNDTACAKDAFTANLETGLYKVRVHFKPTGDTSASEVTVDSVNTVGVLKTTPASSLVVVPVPFKALGGSGEINVSDYIKSGLANGDTLHVYNGSNYDSWTYNGQSSSWEKTTNMTVNDENTVSTSESAAPSVAALSRGTAAILRRAPGNTDPLVFVGDYTGEAAQQITAGWNLVASPSIEPFKPADKFKSGKIQIPTDNIPLNYTYSATTGKWGYSGVVKEGDKWKIGRIEVETLDAGTGFWYISDKATSVTW